MIRKTFLTVFIALLGFNQAHASDSSLFRLVCFDVWPDTLNRKEKVIVIEQKNTDTLTAAEFLSGEHLDIGEFNITVFRDVQEVVGTYHPSDLDIDARAFSDRLFQSQTNFQTYRGTGQAQEDRRSFSWYNDANQRVGHIATGRGEDIHGAFIEDYVGNELDGGGSLMCLDPVFIEPTVHTSQVIQNEETPAGTQSAASNAAAN